MNVKTLWIMCGAPASGKSSWLAKHKLEDGIIVSRDEVRFSIITDNDDYFKYEDKVFNTFINKIREAFKTSNNVYADATHLNERSRNKLIRALNMKNININCVNMNTPFETCKERNFNRTGRAVVPLGALRRMFFSYVPATYEEKYHYNKIINIGGD